MCLTTYSKDFDEGEGVSGKGMSGKVFLEDGRTGEEFGDFMDALLRADDSGKLPLELVVCFRKDGMQMFRKFTIALWDNGSPADSKSVNAF